MPADFVNEKKFKGTDAKITLRYHRNTQMVTVQGPAAFLDESEKMVTQVFQIYKTMIDSKEVVPMPAGGRKLGSVLNYLMKNGVKSAYKVAFELEQAFESKKATQVVGQVYLPEDPEFHAAVGELCYEGARRLHNFPLWKQKFLQTMLSEFGACHDMILDLSDQPEKFDLTDEEWKSEVGEADDQSMSMAKSKARPKAIQAAHAGFRES